MNKTKNSMVLHLLAVINERSKGIVSVALAPSNWSVLILYILQFCFLHEVNLMCPLMTDVRCVELSTFCSSLQPMGTAFLCHPFTQNTYNYGDCTYETCTCSYTLMHMQLWPICFFCLCANLLLAPSQSGADVAYLQRNQTRPFHTALCLPHLVPLLLTGTHSQTSMTQMTRVTSEAYTFVTKHSIISEEGSHQAHA